MTSVPWDLPEPLVRLVRKDLQGRKGQSGLRDPREPLERLDLKVLRAPRVTLALRDLPGPWVQQA